MESPSLNPKWLFVNSWHNLDSYVDENSWRLEEQVVGGGNRRPTRVGQVLPDEDSEAEQLRWHWEYSFSGLGREGSTEKLIEANPEGLFEENDVVYVDYAEGGKRMVAQSHRGLLSRDL